MEYSLVPRESIPFPPDAVGGLIHDAPEPALLSLFLLNMGYSKSSGGVLSVRQRCLMESIYATIHEVVSRSMPRSVRLFIVRSVLPTGEILPPVLVAVVERSGGIERVGIFTRENAEKLIDFLRESGIPLSSRRVRSTLQEITARELLC